MKAIICAYIYIYYIVFHIVKAIATIIDLFIFYYIEKEKHNFGEPCFLSTEVNSNSNCFVEGNGRS